MEKFHITEVNKKKNKVFAMINLSCCSALEITHFYLNTVVGIRFNKKLGKLFL